MKKYWLLGFLEVTFILVAIALLRRSYFAKSNHSSLAYSQIYSQKVMPSPSVTRVLGSQTTANLTPTAMVWRQALDPVIPSAIPTLTPFKSSYTIVLYGDSMVDTMGKELPALRRALRERYPNTQFTFLNRGLGSENVETGLNRFEKEIKPYGDILISGSYSYNPFVPHSIFLHREYLSKLLKAQKKIYSQVYLLVEIAPSKDFFGKGQGGVNWNQNDRYIQATNIIALLENSLLIGREQQVQVIDAYTPSKKLADKSGNLDYISTDDYIHPSNLGHKFMAELIAEQISLNY